MGTRAGDNGRSNPKTSEEREGLVPTSDTKEEHDLHHKLFFEASDDGMLLAATDGSILDANAEACRILQRSREELLTVSFDEIFDLSDLRLKNAWEEQRRTGRFRGELRLLCRDGTPFSAEVSLAAYLGDDGEGETSIVFRDSADSKRAEEELLQSKEFFRLLVENTLDIISVHDSNTRIRYVNSAVRQILGYRPEEFVGIKTADLVHPDDFYRMAKDTARAFESTGSYGLGEHRYRHKNGSYRYLQAHVNNLLDDPNIKGIVSSVRDVTERKRLEERLRFLSLLVENMEDVIGVAEADWTIRYMSPSVEHVLGYRPEEMVGTNSFDYLHPDELKRAESIMADAVSIPGPSQRIEFSHRHKDGSWRYLETTGNNLLGDPHVKGILFVSRDITERKQGEEALRESEQHLRMLTENMLDFILVSEADGAVRYLSPSIERILGYTPEEFAEFKPQDVVHPDDVEEIMGAIAESRANPGVNPTAEVRYRHKDGSWRWISSIANNLLHDPNVGALVISGRDVTERKRAEKEIRRLNETLEKRVAERTAQLEDTVAKLESNERMLRESEEKFRTTFDQAAVGIAHVSPDGRWLRVNRKLCQIVGYTREELLKKTFQELTHSDDLENDLNNLRRMLAGEIDTYSIEKRYVKKDYSIVWVNLTVSLVREPSGDPGYFISVVEDITERKQAERVLRSLTSREIEVLRLLAQGLTNPEIAQTMAFSVSTVKNHIQQIIHKLGVSDRTQAAVRAVELGLLEPE